MVLINVNLLGMGIAMHHFNTGDILVSKRVKLNTSKKPKLFKVLGVNQYSIEHEASYTLKNIKSGSRFVEYASTIDKSCRKLSDLEIAIYMNIE